MLNTNHLDIQSALTGEENGMIRIPGNIPGLSRLYKEDPGKETDTKLSYEDMASPLGEVAAEKRYLEEPSYQTPVNYGYMERIQSFYLMMNAAPYYGWGITPVLYETGRDPTGRVYRSFFKRTSGYDKEPERILALRIGDRTSAVFDPDYGVFLPTAGFSKDPELESRLVKNPNIVKRACAYIHMLCGSLKPPFNDRFRAAFTDLMAPYTPNELSAEASLLRAEPKADIPADVTDYLNRVSPGSNAALVCGYPGEDGEKILLERPCLIYVAPGAPSAGSGWRIGRDQELIPPLEVGSTLPDRIACNSGHIENGPAWAEVTVEFQGTVHRRVYNLDRENCETANPNTFVDAQAGIPAGIFQKFNYLEQGSTAAARELTVPKSSWTLLPYDSAEVVDSLGSFQDKSRRWTLHQRKTPPTHLKLTREIRTPMGQTEEIPLGTVILPEEPHFVPKDNIRNIAFDLGSSRSVRLMTIKGTGRFEPLADLRPDTGRNGAETAGTLPFLRPMTPIGQKTLDEIAEFSYDRLGDGGTYIEPLVQRFTIHPAEGRASGTAGLMSRNRIWRPDMDKLFGALMNDTGSMNDARTRVGVDATPKERLSNSDLSEEDRYAARAALRFYIGTLFMESIFKAAQEGYSFGAGNLYFGVSFPDNGSDTGLTREVREAIRGASEFVNEYLTPQNRLVEDVNLFLYAENRATNVWHSKNPPKGMFMGRTVAAATFDCGNTTLDFTLSTNDHAYPGSIPYAGRKITNESISEGYIERPEDITDCFPDIRQKCLDLEIKAKKALNAASKASQGRLDQRLGFSMTLSQLFNECDFSVTGPNADQRMHRVQRLISIKEFITIPAIAATIAKAVAEGDISLKDDIYIAPVGRGSLALKNTYDGFRERYVLLIKRQLLRILGEEYLGNIVFMENNDVHKRSVAEGILYMMEGTVPDLVNIPLYGPETTLEDHYLDMVYGEQSSPKKETAKSRLRGLDLPETCAEYRDAFDSLYDEAFKALMNGYSIDDFKESYNTWGLTGRLDNGFTDRMVRDEVEKSFSNMIAEARETMKYFIMSYPGVEKEHVCGSLLDICLRRIASRL